MSSYKKVSKCCHGKPQPSETNLQKEMSSTVATPKPPRALKIKYTDLQLKAICWETNEGELVTVTFQSCLITPINNCTLKQLLLSQTLGFIILTTAHGSHTENKRGTTVLTSAKAVDKLRVNVLMVVDVARRSYYLKTEGIQVN